MKTREGIYFGNREIVERYVGNKLVWQKEIVLMSGEMLLYTWNDSTKILSITFSFDKSVKIPDLEPYNITTKIQKPPEDRAIIKNSYVVINNVKYKDVTIYFNFYSDAGRYKTYYFLLQFQTLTRYQEVKNYCNQNTSKLSAAIIARKQYN